MNLKKNTLVICKRCTLCIYFYFKTLSLKLALTERGKNSFAEIGDNF